MPALKGKYERFCQEYVIDYNGTQAAVRTGYGKKSARQQASRLLAKDEILGRVRELQVEQVGRLGLSQDYVVLQLLDTYKCCREASPVMRYDYDLGEMVETGIYQFDSKGALRALELLGKHLGLFDSKAAQKQEKENNLVEQLIASTEEDIEIDDLPEVQ